MKTPAWKRKIDELNKSWSMLLAQVIADRETMGGLLFDCVSKLKWIFDNPDFIRDCESNDQDRLSRLSSSFSYGAYSILHLFMMIKHFPERKDWAELHVSEIYWRADEMEVGESQPEAITRTLEKPPTTCDDKDAEKHIVRMRRKSLEGFAVELRTESERLKSALVSAIEIITEHGLPTPKELEDV